MNRPAAFRAWLDPAAASAPTVQGISLIGLDQLDLADADAAALISAMADIIVSACAQLATPDREQEASAA